MSEVQVTNEQIVTFRQIAELYVRNADRNDHDNTLLYHAVDKMFKKLKKKHEAYIDKQNAYRRAHAMTDPKTKKLLISAGNYEYTRDEADKLDKVLRELQYRKVTIKAEIVDESQIPDDLKFEFQSANGTIGVCSDYETRSAFAGFVIPAAEVEEEEEEEEISV